MNLFLSIMLILCLSFSCSKNNKPNTPGETSSIEDYSNNLYISLEKTGPKPDYENTKIFHVKVGLKQKDGIVKFHSMYDGHYYNNETNIDEEKINYYDGIDFDYFKDLYECKNIDPQKIERLKERISIAQSGYMPLHPAEKIDEFEKQNHNRSIICATTASMFLDGIFPGILPNIYELQKNKNVPDKETYNDSLQIFKESVDGPDGLVEKGICKKLKSKFLPPTEEMKAFKSAENNFEQQITNHPEFQRLNSLIRGNQSESEYTCAKLIKKIPSSVITKDIPYENLLVENLFQIFGESDDDQPSQLKDGDFILVKEFGRVGRIPNLRLTHLIVGNIYCFEIQNERADLQSEALRSVDIDIEQLLNLKNFYKPPYYYVLPPDMQKELQAQK